jgi:hypothetical protein
MSLLTIYIFTHTLLDCKLRQMSSVHGHHQPRISTADCASTATYICIYIVSIALYIYSTTDKRNRMFTFASPLKRRPLSLNIVEQVGAIYN